MIDAAETRERDTCNREAVDRTAPKPLIAYPTPTPLSDSPASLITIASLGDAPSLQ